MPGPWRVKYSGTCARCGVVLEAGTPAVWDRATRIIRCIECPPVAETGEAAPAPGPVPSPPLESAPESAPPPPSEPAGALDTGTAGRSARAEHDRREAKRQAAITDRWGTGFVAKVVRTFSGEPQSTRAWAIGAAGEEKLAAELAKVSALLMLHDRRVPGTRGNIDHIVIGPAGVFVVDAKNHTGLVAWRDRGTFLHADVRLTVGGRDCSALADAMGWQVDAVRTALTGLESEAGALPVTPVLCFVRADWPIFGAPDEFRGVRLESPRSLARLVSAPTRLAPDQAERLAAHLATRLPAK